MRSYNNVKAVLYDMDGTLVERARHADLFDRDREW